MAKNDKDHLVGLLTPPECNLGNSQWSVQRLSRWATSCGVIDLHQIAIPEGLVTGSSEYSRGLCQICLGKTLASPPQSPWFGTNLVFLFFLFFFIPFHSSFLLFSLLDKTLASPPQSPWFGTNLLFFCVVYISYHSSFLLFSFLDKTLASPPQSPWSGTSPVGFIFFLLTKFFFCFRGNF